MPKLIKLNCPNCNAVLEVDSDRNQLFCSYCGQKILLVDDEVKVVNVNIRKTVNVNKTVKNVNVDEAGVKKAEAEIRRVSFEEKKYASELRRKNTKIVFMIFLVIAGVLLTTSGFSGLWNDKNANEIAMSLGMFITLLPFLAWMIEVKRSR